MLYFTQIHYGSRLDWWQVAEYATSKDRRGPGEVIRNLRAAIIQHGYPGRTVLRKPRLVPECSGHRIPAIRLKRPMYNYLGLLRLLACYTLHEFTMVCDRPLGCPHVPATQFRSNNCCPSAIFAQPELSGHWQSAKHSLERNRK
jgi:hypothetical protein